MAVVSTEKISGDPTASYPSFKEAKYDPKLKKKWEPQICHLYGTRSKTKAALMYVKSLETKKQSDQREH